MRKILGLLSGCALVGCLFAGCGDDNDDAVRAYCEAVNKCDPSNSVKICADGIECDDRPFVDRCVSESQKAMTACSDEMAAYFRCATKAGCNDLNIFTSCLPEIKAEFQCAQENKLNFGGVNFSDWEDPMELDDVEDFIGAFMDF